MSRRGSAEWAVAAGCYAEAAAMDDLEPQDDEPTVDENGVDLTLVRMYLDLTPRQRLESLVNYVNTITRVRRLNGASGRLGGDGAE